MIVIIDGGSEMKTNLSSLTRKKNLAREKLYNIMHENDHEWLVAKKFLRSYEDQFVKLWEGYKIDTHYIEQEFFICCDQLRHYIYEERRMDIEFKKIYKPYYDKFQKLNKEYNKVKTQQKRKEEKI